MALVFEPFKNKEHIKKIFWGEETALMEFDEGFIEEFFELLYLKDVNLTEIFKKVNLNIHNIFDKLEEILQKHEYSILGTRLHIYHIMRELSSEQSDKLFNDDFVVGNFYSDNEMNNKVIIIEKIYQVVKYYQLVHGNKMKSEEYVTKLTNIKIEKINDDNVITF